MKQSLLFLLTCIAAQLAHAELSLAEKNAAENAAIKKEWESWNVPFQSFQPLRLIEQAERRFVAQLGRERESSAEKKALGN